MGKIAISHCEWCRASPRCGSGDKAGSGGVAGSGDTAFPLRQRSVFAASLLQQCSVFTVFKAYL